MTKKKDKDGNVETIVTQEMHISDDLVKFFRRRWRPEFRENVAVELAGKEASPVRLEQRVEEKPLTSEQAAMIREILGPPPDDF